MTLEKEAYDYYFSTGSHFEKWTISKEIGSGGMGKVFLAYMQNVYENRNYAVIKVLPASQISLPLFQKFLKQEYAILSNLSDHINIVKLLPQDSYFVYKGGEEVYYLTLEYCPGGNLAQFLDSYEKKKMPCIDAFLILEQILRGILYAHERNIVHGDICAENILLMRPNNFKIADFGVANIARNEIFMQGKRLLYQAPETIDNFRVSFKSDVWSIGVLMYKLITGNFPFIETNEKRLLHKINTEPIHFPESIQQVDFNTIDGSVIYFIKQMLSKNPSKRPTAKELYNALQRCRHLLDSGKLESFENKFIKQVELKDQRPKAPPKSISIENTLKKEKKVNRSFLERRKFNATSFFTLCFCLTLLGLFSYLNFFQRTQKPSIELSIKPIIPSYKYKVTIFARRPSGQRIALRHIRGQKVRIFFGYFHQSGIMKEISAPTKAITGNYIWAIPEDIPDGKVTLWARYIWKKNKPIRSNLIHINIVGLQKERKYFRDIEKLEDAKKRSNNTLLKKYKEYISLYPKGFFKDKAHKKIKRLNKKLEMQMYLDIITFIKTDCKKYQEALKKCKIFLTKYPRSTKKQSLLKIQKFYEKLKTPHKYTITLENGYIQNKMLKADCYVKIYKNKKLLFTSKIIKDNNKPSWKKKIPLTWKIGDTLRVEMWDKNVSLWKDKLYFFKENTTPFSIEMFIGKIGNAKQWIAFKTDFDIKKGIKDIIQ